MKIYPRLISKLYGEPLLLEESARMSFEAGLQAAMQGNGFEVEKPEREHTYYEKIGNVGLIRIHGAISKQMSMMEALCMGGCDLSSVDKALLQIAQDEQVEIVVLDINSPGGGVTGVQETASRIAALRETKEVHAFCEGMMCSAAYWLGSQVDSITVTTSSKIGSIGVYLALLDRTRQLEQEGIKVELIKAGKLKAMGAPFKSLTDEEREHLQAGVDKIHAQFKAAVTTLRNISDDTMQGQSFPGDEAIKLNLADNLTNQTLDEFVATLLTSP